MLLHTSVCKFKVMSSLTRFPDRLALVPPRPNNAYMECTSLTWLQYKLLMYRILHGNRTSV
ncbi:hypothetical protein EV363DRAFT_1261914 [Boletus edulis]|nr:hypothetical protein EV363DRAFT_1261914 [Boletus edulis]